MDHIDDSAMRVKALELADAFIKHTNAGDRTRLEPNIVTERAEKYLEFLRKDQPRAKAQVS